MHGTQCPNPIHDERKRELYPGGWYREWARLVTPMTGRTDVVSCRKCGIVVPRFLEPPTSKPKTKRQRGGPKPKRPWRGAGIGGSWSHPQNDKRRQIAEEAEQVREAAQ